MESTTYFENCTMILKSNDSYVTKIFYRLLDHFIVENDFYYI